MRPWIIPVVFIISMALIGIGLCGLRSSYNEIVDPQKGYFVNEVSHRPFQNVRSFRKTNPAVLEKLLTLLKKFSTVAQNHGLAYWAWGGTLLGTIRHRGFIPWDDDIDLAVPLHQRGLLLSNAFAKDLSRLGLKLTSNRYAMSVIRVQFKYSKTLKPPFIDIFFTVETEGNVKVCFKLRGNVCKLTNPKIVWPRGDIYPLKMERFEDTNIPVPAFPKKVIEQEFSKDALQNPIIDKQNHNAGNLLPSIDVKEPSIVKEIKTFKHWVQSNPLAKIISPFSLSFSHP